MPTNDIYKELFEQIKSHEHKLHDFKLSLEGLHNDHSTTYKQIQLKLEMLEQNARLDFSSEMAKQNVLLQKKNAILQDVIIKEQQLHEAEVNRGTGFVPQTLSIFDGHNLAGTSVEYKEVIVALEAEVERLREELMTVQEKNLECLLKSVAEEADKETKTKVEQTKCVLNDTVKAKVEELNQLQMVGIPRAEVWHFLALMHSVSLLKEF